MTANPYTVEEAKQNVATAKASRAEKLTDYRDSIVAKWERVVATAEMAALADEALELLERLCRPLKGGMGFGAEDRIQAAEDARALLRRSGR